MNFRQINLRLKQSLPIDKNMVDSLYGFSSKSQLATLGFVVFVVLFLYPELSTSIVLWGLVLFSFILYRLYTVYQYRTMYEKYSLYAWYKIFLFTSLATALMASLLGFIYVHLLNEYYQLFVVTVLVGATSVSTSSLSADYRIAIAYISIVLVPLGLSLFSFFTMHSFALGVLVFLLYVAQIFMILNNYYQGKSLKELYRKVKMREEENKSLLEENRQFIADMVHQIKTPLSIIMTNTEIIELESGMKDSPNVKRINSSISALSNSFEDLSYVIANESIEYKPVSIDLKEFLKERIDYFSIIAETREQNIVAVMPHQPAWIIMNDIELERLIDNNLSNAIKHSIMRSEIKVVLESKRTAVVLKFISKGKTIKDATRIFEKNYTENYRAKRSLGLGLSMVKHISQKNDIEYSAYSMDGTNTFTYAFNVSF